jgi:hypothetical protein
MIFFQHFGFYASKVQLRYFCFAELHIVFDWFSCVKATAHDQSIEVLFDGSVLFTLRRKTTRRVWSLFWHGVHGQLSCTLHILGRRILSLPLIQHSMAVLPMSASDENAKGLCILTMEVQPPKGSRAPSQLEGLVLPIIRSWLGSIRHTWPTTEDF